MRSELRSSKSIKQQEVNKVSLSNEPEREEVLLD